MALYQGTLDFCNYGWVCESMKIAGLKRMFPTLKCPFCSACHCDDFPWTEIVQSTSGLLVRCSVCSNLFVFQKRQALWG